MTSEELKGVVERLKQEKLDDFATGKKGAFELGVEWAKKKASLRDLRRVGELEQEMDDEEFIDMVDRYYDSKNGIEEDIADRGCDRKAYIAGYREGFTEGAAPVWGEVAPQL